MHDDDQRTELATRETRAYNYLIANNKKRTAQLEARTLLLQWATLFLAGATVGAITWNLILEWAGRL